MTKTESTWSALEVWLDDMGRHHLMSESNRPYLEAAAEVRRLEEEVAMLTKRIAELERDNACLKTQVDWFETEQAKEAIRLNEEEQIQQYEDGCPEEPTDD